jgi:hypothetical protein
MLTPAGQASNVSEIFLSIGRTAKLTGPLQTRGLTLEIRQIIAELKKESERIDRAIAALEGMESSPIATKGRGPGRPSTHPNLQTAPTSEKRGHSLTAEGRRRLSEAMKKRWAERRKKA